MKWKSNPLRISARACFREIHEETTLECSAEDLRFFGLFAAPYLYHFRFTVRLPIHSEDVNHYHRSGEFSRLVAITQEEAMEMNMPMTGVFHLWRPYLPLLLDVLEGQATDRSGRGRGILMQMHLSSSSDPMLGNFIRVSKKHLQDLVRPVVLYIPF